MSSLSSFDLETLLNSFADRVGARLADQLKGRGRGLEPRLLSVKEAAGYLGRSMASLRHMIADGGLPIVRSDHRVFLDIRELDKWIDENRQG
jgi:excisionase family DNA binding protein